MQQQQQQQEECELFHKQNSSTNQNLDYSYYLEKDLTEREIAFGIEERLNSFAVVASGLLKKRYSDFLVNEIDLEGNVLRLDANDKLDLQIEQPQEQEQIQTQDLSLLAKWLNQEKLNLLSEGKAVETEEISQKSERSSIHQSIREKFANEFVSETAQGTNKIKIIPKSQSSCMSKDRRNNHQANQITRFLLRKENRDTMECVGFIASLLRCSKKSISFAGTKDKRAITVQAVTIRGIAQNRLAGLKKTLRNAQIGNFKQVDSMLGLGDLKGNEFTIILRDLTFVNGGCCIQEMKEELANSISHLSSKGFINYYGLQRFGTGSQSSCSIGEAILKGQWKEAVKMIMASHVPSCANLASLQAQWLEDESKQEFLSKIPSRLVAERAIANFLLSNSQTNYLGALECIPRELRMLYLHAYQSLIWNQAASCRIRFNANQVVLGDLVQEKHSENVILITDETQLNCYSITDVVLPLPGFDAVYPQIEQVLNVYRPVMELFQDKDLKNRTIASLSGSYRKLIQIPVALRWNIQKYSCDEIPLTSSFDSEVASEGEKIALVISFQLPTSSYATMCLRECISLKA